MVIKTSEFIARGNIERPKNVVKITPSDIELAKANTAVLTQISDHFNVPGIQLLKAPK